jgi:hypothetical protein
VKGKHGTPGAQVETEAAQVEAEASQTSQSIGAHFFASQLALPAESKMKQRRFRMKPRKQRIKLGKLTMKLQVE